MLRDIKRNPFAKIDFYTLSHQVLKENTDFEVSHIYNRGEGENDCPNGMILYGFLENMEEILTTELEHWMIDEIKQSAIKMGIGAIFERGLEKILRRVVDELAGYLPLEIQLMQEGTWIPSGTPFAQVRNTVKGFSELVTLPEGVFLHNHFAAGCATRAFHMRNYLVEKQEQYGYDDSFLGRFHSFGFRGHNSDVDAYWAGTAWALFLNGTDDFHVSVHLPEAPLSSIPALAHKVTQQWDSELDCFINSIYQAADSESKVVALVIDTYNADKVIEEWIPSLSIYAKTCNVHVVYRPDSGDVLEQTYRIWQQCQKYGLDNVSVIIGEGMSFENAKKADEYFEYMNVPLNFVSYGIGAGFYKDIDRDFLGYAMKTSFSNNKPRMKFGMTQLKQSIPNIVDVVKNKNGEVEVILEKDVRDRENSLYRTVYYHDGNLASSLIVHVFAEDWYGISELAKQQVASQDKVVISNEIKETIEVLRNEYVTN